MATWSISNLEKSLSFLHHFTNLQPEYLCISNARTNNCIMGLFVIQYRHRMNFLIYACEKSIAYYTQLNQI